MLKNIAVILMICMVIIISCGKKNNPLPPISNLIITGWTPKVPTPTETITIAGTGFDPNASGNKILFDNAYTGIIVSATATEIKVIRDTSGSLQLQDWNSGNTVTVNALGNSFTHPDKMFFRRGISLIDAKSYTTNQRIFYPGDSILLEGTGFYSDPDDNSCYFSYSGATGKVNIARTDSSYYTKMVGFYPSTQAIGGSEDTPPDYAVSAKIEVKDKGGATASLPCSLRVFPHTEIVFDSYEYNDKFDILKLFVRTKNVLPGTDGIFRNTVTQRAFPFTLAQDYSGEVKVVLLQLQGDPLNPTEDIPPGTYRLAVNRGAYNFISMLIELK
ncbi:MAG: IPT/TIG domain-containing protein [Chitinophagaceae bacterium]|nr:IPT/TIG domain-containing protein [Chitinophagaceae bacterium]